MVSYNGQTPRVMQPGSNGGLSNAGAAEPFLRNSPENRLQFRARRPSNSGCDHFESPSSERWLLLPRRVPFDSRRSSPARALSISRCVSSNPYMAMNDPKRGP